VYTVERRGEAANRELTPRRAKKNLNNLGAPFANAIALSEAKGPLGDINLVKLAKF
jgi:hypothetical protein